VLPLRAMAGGLAPKSELGVRLFVFDFDQTLSKFHVFKALAGWGPSSGFQIPPPHCSTEAGQLSRMEELSADEFREEGGFAHVAFGGKERVQQLRKGLEELHGTGAELIICTKGLVGTVNKVLFDLDMHKTFAQVYGRLTGAYGASSYDKKCAAGSADVTQYLGTAEQSEWHTKDKLIARIMAQRGLQQQQVILVEDDPEEVKNAAGVCRTLLVKEARGVQEEHLRELLRMAREPVSASPPVPQQVQQQVRPQERRCLIM